MKPDTVRTCLVSIVRVCGSGSSGPLQRVCQIVAGLPSSTFSARPSSPSTSSLSAVTVQPARPSTATAGREATAVTPSSDRAHRTGSALDHGADGCALRMLAPWGCIKAPGRHSPGRFVRNR